MPAGYGARPYGLGRHGERLEPVAPAPSQPLIGRFGFVGSMVYGGRGRKWSAVIVDNNSQVVARVPSTALGPITQRRNAPASIDVSADMLSADAAAFADGLFHQLQVRRGDVLWFYGPITDDDFDPDTYTAKVQGPWWHLQRLHVGPAGRTNLLSNGDFSEGQPSDDLLTAPGRWFGSRTEGLSFQPLTASMLTRVRTPRRPDTIYSLKADAPTGDSDDQLRVTQACTVYGGQAGRNVDFVGWFYVPTTGGLVEPSHKDRGVFLTTTKAVSAWEVPPPVGYFTENIDYAQSRITAEHPRDTWVRHTASVFVPPGKTRMVWCSLNCPPGISYWADCKLFSDEALEFFDDDVFDIVDGLVEHAVGKSSIDFRLSVVGDQVGTQLDRVYPYDRHQNIADAIQQLAEEGHFDWEERFTSSARFIAVESPRIGTYKRGMAVRYGPGSRGNLLSFRYSRPGSSASSDVIALGIGQGYSREEESASDDTYTDGLTLEEVFVADETSDGSSLRRLAVERLAVVKNPRVLEVTVPPHAQQVTGLFVGDVIDVKIKWGPLDFDARYEVVEKKTDPQTDSATFTLNPERPATYNP